MNRARLKQTLMRHEGLRLKPYRDTVGILTIGYGRNLDDVGISKLEADFLLVHDIDRALADAERVLPYFDALDDARQEVVVNMIFNLGCSKFLEFRKLIRALKDGDFEKAADEMVNSLWYRQVGVRGKELVRLMREGAPKKEYPDNMILVREGQRWKNTQTGNMNYGLDNALHEVFQMTNKREFRLETDAVYFIDSGKQKKD